MTKEKEKKTPDRIVVSVGEIFPDYEGERIIARKTAKIGDQGYTYEISMPAPDIAGWENLIGMPDKECRSKLAKTIMHGESWFTPKVNELIKAGKDIESDEFIAEIKTNLEDALQYTERKASKATKQAEELARLKSEQAQKDALMKKMLGLPADCSEEDYIAALAKASA